MMRALDPAIYDTLFRLVVERLPSPPTHRYGGCRSRISDEICFRGLFWRFVTGAAWETVEVMMDRQVSDTTLRSRRDEWVAAGVFDDLMEHALGEYDRLIGIDTDHVAIDGSSQLAPGGGECTGSYPGSKGRLGFKWSCGVDATGIGVGFVIDTGAAATTSGYCAPPWTSSPAVQPPAGSAPCTSTAVMATNVSPSVWRATTLAMSK